MNPHHDSESNLWSAGVVCGAILAGFAIVVVKLIGAVL